MSVFRLNTLRYVLRANVNLRHKPACFHLKQHHRTIANDGKITIDGISKDLFKPENPLFVPKQFCKYLK